MPGLTPPGCLPRVHGSYEQLWAGQVADALVDLTGGLAERWNLKDVAGSSGQQDRPRGTERRTCRQLLSLKDRCLLSCSVLGPRTGRVERVAALWACSPEPLLALPELGTRVLLGLGRERTSVLRAGVPGVPFPPDQPSPEGSVLPSLDRHWPPGREGVCTGVPGTQSGGTISGTAGDRAKPALRFPC